ncbi:sensor histidine kinase [Kineosporia succinea]|uniref:Two-component sensor histidine kinase n=1 Tax=Kineosporia succinea TaxID=84632 RepID=A0ABT9P906_9ACTN|nr:ATP-binding protein [Kineosporia succinea]MDP9829174.1 two-component sensor histidine kinase [Kineosporia succinea]
MIQHHPEAGRPVPVGRPGVRAAADLATARAVLVLRLAAALATAVAGLTLTGPGDGGALRHLLPLAVVGLVLPMEDRVLGRLGEGRPRLVLVTADAVIGLAVVLLAPGDPICVVYQSGTAALAGALLGRTAAPVWIGQALLAAASAGALLGDRSAAPAGILLLLGVSAAVLLAGIAGASAARRLLTRLRDALEPRPAPDPDPEPDPTPEPDPEPDLEQVRHLLRSASLGLIRMPPVMEQVARLLTQDAVEALAAAREPVNGLRFDGPADDFASTLDQLAQEWARAGRVHLSTSPALSPATRRPLGPAARHALAEILAESLENITRHAHATRAGVALRPAGPHLDLTVHDNGRGFEMPGPHDVLHTGRYPGLRRMTDAATTIGATLTLTSEPYSGTTITVRLTP